MSGRHKAVIGLEVHAQLLTKSKIFCGCSAKYGSKPNTNVCPVCLGHPGTLPALNREAVKFISLAGLALNCTINQSSLFARKNYFYPDLPKGYQVSQYDKPVCENGFLNIVDDEGRDKKIRIKRIHLEEDAGKSVHDGGGFTLLNFNRAGVPLIEIVTEPDISSAGEAHRLLKKIKRIVEYLEICSGNMEEGSLRCDANVSVNVEGIEKPGVKTEVKNMNSFGNVERAINFEIARQIKLIEEGKSVEPETLLWNAEKNISVPMRSKEAAHDYRYFTDPDLMPVIISNEWLDEIKQSMPELPDVKKARFISVYGLTGYDADVLTQSKSLAAYYEKTAEAADDYKAASNWIQTEVLKILNEKKIEIDDFLVPPENLAELIRLIDDETINGRQAKDVFVEMLEGNKKAADIVKNKNLIQITDEAEITKAVDAVLAAHKKEAAEYLNGKKKLLGYFTGKVIKAAGGKVNPAAVNKILKKKLTEL